MNGPFKPADAATVNIDVSAATQRVLIADSPTNIRIMNNGTATVWIRFGGSTVNAALTDIPVGPGTREIVTFAQAGACYVAAIAAGLTGKIYFTPGLGS